MLIIGVTGGFATGKTTVVNLFAGLGAEVIDADKIAHNIIRRNSPAFREIILDFGKDILSENKSIDRKKLSKKVFNDKKALEKLCRITHPLIIDRIKKRLCQIERANYQSIVVIDAPLLIEANLDKIVDWILVVDALLVNQLRRGAARGIDQREVNRIIKAQLPLAAKKKLADYIIDNNNTLLKTKKQVEKIWREIKQANIGL